MRIGRVVVGNELPLCLIAGACQLESKDHAFSVAGRIQEIAKSLGIAFVYKTSFDKANRSSAKAPRGLGFEKSLAVFESLRQELGIPVTTDVHELSQCAEVATVVDMLQIPALLCKQTDLICAAADTGKPVNIKKGQFLAPNEMLHVVEKIRQRGNDSVMITERGTSFGYHNLVNDFRGIPLMKTLIGCPIFFDATTSVQTPGLGRGDYAGTRLHERSGGQREFVEPLARAAAGIGVAGIFLEVHDDPKNAPSDGDLMVPLKSLEALLEVLLRIDAASKSVPGVILEVH